MDTSEPEERLGRHPTLASTLYFTVGVMVLYFFYKCAILKLRLYEDTNICNLKKGVIRMLTFGEFFKKRRINLGLSLREFCEKNDLDPGNISKLERGKLPPPKEAKLKEYAKYLKLKKENEKWHEFFELAAIASKKLPPEFSKTEVVEKLPIFFRTVRGLFFFEGKKLSKEKLEKLIEIIKEM